MFFALNRTVKFVLAGLVVLVLGKFAWNHRGDDWVANLLRPHGRATQEIKFDNGSVRDAAVANAPSVAPDAAARSVKNEAGQLKKCVAAGKVTYTDQVCPVGAKVAAVNGGSVVVLEAQKSKAQHNAAAPGGQKALRDALDISGGEDLKNKMIERAVDP